MRTRLIALVGALLMLIGVSASAPTALAAPPPASASQTLLSVQTVPLATTIGDHTATFYSCTVDNRRAKMELDYEVSIVVGIGLEIEGVRYITDWNGHPPFNANAVRVDVESNPGSWSEISPAWGGSSTTLDDMPTNYIHTYSSLPWDSFNNTDTPQLRARFYGVGAGSIENRCDDKVNIQ